MKRIARSVKRIGTDAAKRSEAFRRFARGALGISRSINYRMRWLQMPVDERTVVFEAFGSRSYACSPKAIYRAMLGDPRFDDFTLIWSFERPEEQADPELSRATKVAFRSKAYLDAHARAKYWITNSIIPEFVTPRTGQVYVQTWHGTPLKRLGCDIRSDASGNVMFSADEIHRRYQREGRRLDFLLSPSRFATEKLASAFAIESGRQPRVMVEEGYPRNDALALATPATIEAAKDRLGVAGKRTVLYAPTFRDDQHVSATGYALELDLDFAKLREQLGPGHVVLFRAHYLIASAFDFAATGGFVVDVSGVDDINEVYLASDLLVTDYSSVFFDYANLRRPIVFYMADLEHYARELRGLYLDVSELPGPITRTQDELAAAVLASRAPDAAVTERLARFADRFTYLDDGHASERVIARVFD